MEIASGKEKSKRKSLSIHKCLKYLQYQEFVAIDVETTGLDPFKNKIIEIGAAKFLHGELTVTFSRLINPQCEIPEFITQINGITNEMVQKEKTIEEIMPEFLNFIGDLPLLAHNCSFDLKFIKNNLPPGRDLNNPTIDTLKIARLMFPEFENHKLGTVTKHLGIINENQHRALSDAIAAGQVYLACQSRLQEVS